MNMRVVSESLAPGVEHCGNADAGAKMARIGGDRDQRLGGGAEQDGIDGGLVVEGDRGDWRRQREHDVEVRDRQKLGLAPSASQLARARPWHFGQCRLRQEL